MQTLNFQIFADFFQFYLEDGGLGYDTRDIWNSESLNRMLAVGDGFIAVGTSRNMDVPVKIVISNTEPGEPLDDWQQVNECSIKI